MAASGLTLVLLALMAGTSVLGGLAHAQDGGGLGGPGVVDLSSAVDALIIDGVDVRVSGSTGDDARDAAILAAARAKAGLVAGDRLSTDGLSLAVARIEGLTGVDRAQASIVFAGGDVTRRKVVVEVALAPTNLQDPVAGKADLRFPYLWRGDRGALKVMLSGGHGFFSDGNPWFGNAAAFTTGNPLVQNPAAGAETGSRATWVESWLEFGLAGVSQLGDSNAALYGALTGIAVIARGQDIFRDDPRQSIDVEKAYLGLLWGNDDRSRSVNLSFGRQNFSLNDGFLISQYGSQFNAGPRPGIYLAPRTTHDMAGLATVKVDNWTGTAFYLDPNEYEPFESNTKLAGLNLRYNFTDKFYADASYITALESKTGYSAPSGSVGTRDGLRTFAAHVRWADPGTAPGLWLEGELAHQTHSDFDMDAWAGYGTVGYLFGNARWKPSISYRYSAFSGDDPDTPTYERFDALYSGGLSEWLQGISLGKVLRPENRLSHRIRLNVAPNDRLNLTLDWFMHHADELNNIGGNSAISTLSSTYLGQELQFTARWAVSKQVYFLGIASVAFPGKALRDAAGSSAEDWTTLQAQLFWTF